jgi:hypothetical protein
MTDTASLGTCIDLYAASARAIIALRVAEEGLPLRLMGEMRERRLKPYVDAFISNYQQAVRVARTIWGENFKEMEEKANALDGSLTADEATRVGRELRIWLKTFGA